MFMVTLIISVSVTFEASAANFFHWKIVSNTFCGIIFFKRTLAGFSNLTQDVGKPCNMFPTKHGSLQWQKKKKKNKKTCFKIIN